MIYEYEDKFLIDNVDKETLENIEAEKYNLS